MIGLLDPAVSSKNVGDFVISHYCHKELEDMFPQDYLLTSTTHSHATGYALKNLEECRIIFVGGSNLLCHDVRSYNQWHYRHLDHLDGEVVLMGVGWNDYNANMMSTVTEMAMKNLLSRDFTHSVRDEFTADRLREIGIDNVINTGCPTTWGLTQHRVGVTSPEVVLTVNHAAPIEVDRDNLWFALKNYDMVHCFPQDHRDVKRFADLGRKMIHRCSFNSLRKLMEQPADYLGTRLHAGIFAANYGRASTIIEIDGRSKHMDIATFENPARIYCEYEVNTWRNANAWRSQFTHV